MNTKTYRPIHVNMNPELLSKLDAYKSKSCPRSVLIHEAVKHYIFLLESRGVKKNN
jgi:metal-responsive CopG/Arc/MetJ family transcriptional regulator